MDKMPLFPDNPSRSSDKSAGRDEMNLAEFPLVLLTDRVPAELKTKKTICYEYSHGGRVTVSGSDAYGLPTAADADVLVGLIQLTRRKNNFTDPKVHFTRYELLKILRWPDEGKYYRRLEESLNRWSGVTLYYDNTWWDNRAKKLVTAKLHVIETIVIDESPKTPGRRHSLPFSFFVWNQTFIESCQADNLKHLDLDTYFGFRSAISKRLYRFLDKRFYRSDEWSFELREFAFDYVGVSRTYAANVGKIKEKLQPALDELEEAEFIEPMPRDKRYTKQGRDWIIRITKRRPPLPSPEKHIVKVGGSYSVAIDAARHTLEQRLNGHGVTPKITAELIRDYPAERIEAKVDLLEWLEEYKAGYVKEPGAWLVRAIRDDYAPPKGYMSKTEREVQRKSADQARKQSEEERQRAADEKSRQRAEADAVDAYWRRLTPDEQAALEDKALKTMPCDPSVLNSPLKRSYLKTIRESYMRTLLFGVTSE